MNALQMASLLDGRSYLREITEQECDMADESGLIVMFGYSDDNVELRGVIDDEVGAWGSRQIRFYADHGIHMLDETFCDKCPLYAELKDRVKTVKAVFGDDGVWRFETNIPHETFKIMEDGELFCEGIVFSIHDM